MSQNPINGFFIDYPPDHYVKNVNNISVLSSGFSFTGIDSSTGSSKTIKILGPNESGLNNYNIIWPSDIPITNDYLQIKSSVFSVNSGAYDIELQWAVGSGGQQVFTQDNNGGVNNINNNIYGGSGAGASLISSGEGNFFAGVNAGRSVTSGDSNIIIGNNITSPILTTGNRNIIIGREADVDDSARSDSILIGDGISCLANNQTCIGISADTSSSNGLFLRHNTTAIGGNSAVWVDNELRDNVSSRRFKEDIRTWERDDNNFDKIRPVIYKAKEGFGVIENDKTDYYGFIAEEIDEIFPQFVIKENDGITPHSVVYSQFVVLLVDELQKLRKRVLELETKYKQ
jgi:hypothetical protein